MYAGNHAHLDSSESFFKYSAKVGKSVEKICTVSRLPFNTGNLRGGFYCRFGFPYAEEFAVGYIHAYCGDCELRASALNSTVL